jgi:hypothetical protein
MKRIFNKIDHLCRDKQFYESEHFLFKKPFVAEIEGKFWTVGTDGIWVIGTPFKGPFDPWDGDNATLGRIFEYLMAPMPNPIEVQTPPIMAWSELVSKKQLCDADGHPVDAPVAGKIAGVLVDARRLSILTSGFGKVHLCKAGVNFPALAISAEGGLFRAVLAGMNPEMQPEIKPFTPGEDFNQILRRVQTLSLIHEDSLMKTAADSEPSLEELNATHQEEEPSKEDIMLEEVAKYDPEETGRDELIKISSGLKEVNKHWSEGTGRKELVKVIKEIFDTKLRQSDSNLRRALIEEE